VAIRSLSALGFTATDSYVADHDGWYALELTCGFAPVSVTWAAGQWRVRGSRGQFGGLNRVDVIPPTTGATVIGVSVTGAYGGLSWGAVTPAVVMHVHMLRGDLFESELVLRRVDFLGPHDVRYSRMTAAQ